MHTNFSTDSMRSRERGRGVIEDAVVALGKRHAEHIAIYGAGLDERLTGLHGPVASKNSSMGLLTEVLQFVSPVMLLKRAMVTSKIDGRVRTRTHTK